MKIDLSVIGVKLLELHQITTAKEVNMLIDDDGVYLYMSGFPLRKYVQDVPTNFLKNNTAIILHGMPEIFDNPRFLIEYGVVDLTLKNNVITMGEFVLKGQLVKYKNVDVTTQYFSIPQSGVDTTIFCKDSIVFCNFNNSDTELTSKKGLTNFKSIIPKEIVSYFRDARVIQTPNRTYLKNKNNDYMFLKKSN